MVAGRKNVIVCGDFNVFKGMNELHDLAEHAGLRIVNGHTRTFPTVKPRKALDLFLCPKDMQNVSARVITDMKMSDHLPVLLEVGV
jgi:endonuclease/exonuclease/phosphatase family metal-dependent hydrolase